MKKIGLVSLLALVSSGVSANHANLPGVCSGTFIRRSCMMESGAHCQRAGTVDDFVGWEDVAGKRGYVLYRMGRYDARDIRLEKGCKLKKY